MAALRADVAASRGLPTAWRDQLLTELALALDAANGYLTTLAGGLTTRKGRLRAPYRAYREISERIAAIAKILGLDKPADPAPADPMKQFQEALAQMRAGQAESPEEPRG